LVTAVAGAIDDNAVLQVAVAITLANIRYGRGLAPGAIGLIWACRRRETLMPYARQIDQSGSWLLRCLAHRVVDG